MDSTCNTVGYRITDNGQDVWTRTKVDQYTYINYYQLRSSVPFYPAGYLYKISKCVKLTNGDGTYDNAYKLDNSMCT